MKGPSREAIWRAAAIGGWFVAYACDSDLRVIVAYGWLAVTALIFIGIVRDAGERRRIVHEGSEKEESGGQ